MLGWGYRCLNRTAVRAGRVRAFFQICCQSHGDAHRCCLGICGSSFPLSPLLCSPAKSSLLAGEFSARRENCPSPSSATGTGPSTTGTLGVSRAAGAGRGSHCPQLQISPFVPPPLSTQSRAAPPLPYQMPCVASPQWLWSHQELALVLEGELGQAWVCGELTGAVQCPHESREPWGHMTEWEGACTISPLEMVFAHWWPQVRWEMCIA